MSNCLRCGKEFEPVVIKAQVGSHMSQHCSTCETILQELFVDFMRSNSQEDGEYCNWCNKKIDGEGLIEPGTEDVFPAMEVYCSQDCLHKMMNQ
jgi:DNA-directed RNA polymerase subunit RPC12/RpoP